MLRDEYFPRGGEGVRGHHGRHQEHRRAPIRLRRGRQGSRQGRLARPEVFGESHAGEGRGIKRPEDSSGSLVARITLGGCHPKLQRP